MATLRNLSCDPSHFLPFRIGGYFVHCSGITGGRRIFPTAESGLGAERLSQFLIGDDLQHRIVAQAVGVIGVLIAGDDLVDALPQ